MAQLQLIPKEFIEIIPKFEGDDKQLNLFISKAEYVIERFRGIDNEPQDLYVFHTVTSRLIGRAATLLSERQDIDTWETLKTVLRQHFADPRSEECVAIELENLKIKQGESYTDFCNRIQHTRSTLLSKVNEIEDEQLKAAKIVIYNNTALNTFLYNLPENLIRILRLKNCQTLESALSAVIEEINFQYQYNSKNSSRPMPQHSLKSFQGQHSNTAQGFNFGIPNQSQAFRFPQNQMPQGFRFGVPNQQHQGLRPLQAQVPQGFRFNQTPQNFRFGIPNQQNNFRSGTPNQQNNFRFGIPPQYQGFRPQYNNYFNRPQPGSFGQYPQRFQFGIPQAQGQNLRALGNDDVTMRTVRQNALYGPDEIENVFYDNESEVQGEQNYMEEYYNEETSVPQIAFEPYDQSKDETVNVQNPEQPENFRLEASNHKLK